MIRLRRGPQSALNRARREGESLMPRNGNLDVLVQHLAHKRGRPIRLIEYDLPPDAPSGLWLAFEQTDYIVVASGAAPARRAAVICHEIAHMLLGHAGNTGTSLAELAAPSLDPRAVARVMGRTGYTNAQEYDAETLGTILATEHRRRASDPRHGDLVSTRLR